MTSEAHEVERWVRNKNNVYRKWRTGKKYEQLDTWCAECLMRFGTLPHWTEHAKARRAQAWTHSRLMERDQRVWKNAIRDWCLARGITTFPAQSAQFYKYYSAWYRVQEEKRHGKIERTYARQMY